MLGLAAVEDALDVALELVEQSEAIPGNLVAELVDKACESVDGEEMVACVASEEQRRDAEVLACSERQDRRLVRQPSFGSGRPADRCGHSPMTWMKIFRGRDRSSSQKKIRCQRPSIRLPSTIGTVCDDDERSPARRCECPLGYSPVSSSMPSVRMSRSSWR